MEISDILKMTPENLAKEQHKELLSHTVKVLQDIVSLLKQGHYDEIRKKYLGYSPTGDGYGLDNNYIDFNFSGDTGGDDIGMVLNRLEELQKMSVNE